MSARHPKHTRKKNTHVAAARHRQHNARNDILPSACQIAPRADGRRTVSTHARQPRAAARRAHPSRAGRRHHGHGFSGFFVNGDSLRRRLRSRLRGQRAATRRRERGPPPHRRCRRCQERTSHRPRRSASRLLTHRRIWLFYPPPLALEALPRLPASRVLKSPLCLARPS